ncbi:MAG: diguanylate cyclase [Candidatus Izimaplasma sp.]|nr:diguanylate cyclase [Candidatus Izimaplasma bacterium]
MEYEFITRFDINIYASFFLIILLGTIYLKKDVTTLTSKLFKSVVVINLVMLIIEILAWTFEGIDTQLAWHLNYFINFIFILLTPVIACLWAMYIDYKIFGSRDRLRKRYYYSYPFIIGFVMLIINMFYPILFRISENNVYNREPFIWVNVATMYSLLFYMIIVAYKNRKIVNENVFFGVTFFMLLPAIGAAFQIAVLGLLLIWPMTALGVLVAYIFLETVGTSRDHLTNLFTRVKSDEYMNNLMSARDEFAVIMIDLDKFKELNDNFGHKEGDNVLKSFGIILMNVFNDNAFVSRFGGDEFFIVTHSNTDEELLGYKQAIYDELAKPMYLNEHLPTLQFSYGYSFFRENSAKTMDELVVDADDNMYRDKAVNKNYKRRKSDL